MTTPIRVQPRPGIQRDGTRFAAEACIDGLWVRWQRGQPRKMQGYRMLTNAMPQVVRELHGHSVAGTLYAHAGSATYLHQLRVTSSGAAPPLDRSPTLAYTADADNLWQFATIFDPVTNNTASLIGHPGRNLSMIDNNVQVPLYMGTVTGTTALFPLSLPPIGTNFTVATVTGDTNSSTSVTNVTPTTNLRKGQTITGTNIPANTYITAINGSTITLSQAATGTTAGVTLTLIVGGVCGGFLVLHPYILAYCSSGKVLWSIANDPNDWWGTGSGEAYITEQKIVAGAVTRGGGSQSPAGLLWSLNSLIRVTFAGGTATWAFDTVADDISILSSRSVVEVDGTFLWVGTDRFMVYNGVVRDLPNDQNINWFFDNLNYDQRQKVFAFRDARWGEVWWCFPFGDATECTHAVIYNYRLGVWYDTELPNGGRSAALQANVYRYPLMAGVEQTSGTYRIWQHNDGTDEVDGSSTQPVQSYFETNDISLVGLPQNAQNRTVRVDWLEPDFVQVGDMTVTVKGSANARASDIEIEAHSFAATPGSPAEQIVPLKSAVRQLRFKFESNAVGGHYEMGKVIAHVEPADGRVTGA